MTRRSLLSVAADGGTSTRQVVLDAACPYTPILTVFFSIALLFALASLVIVAAVQTGSMAFVVAILTIIVDGFIMAVTGSLLYFCRKHRLG